MHTRFDGIWVNRPDRIPLAENKLYQLTMASQLGFELPDTLVSQNPDAIRTFVRRYGNVVVKPVFGSMRGTLEVQTVTEATLPPEPTLKLVPAIWQERLTAQHHLRIHAFGDRHLAVSLESDRLDWRFGTQSNLQEKKISLELASKIAAYLDAMGLEMAIFDFLVPTDGPPVFLEANQQGQFLFLEGQGGIPVTAAFCDFLNGRAACSSP